MTRRNRKRTGEGRSLSWRLGKRTVRAADRLTNLAVVLVILGMVLYVFYSLWDTSHIYSAASTEVYETYRPSEDDTESFAELQAINPDVFGWLTVYGTGIDYPVTQGENNSTYVNTDARGDYALSGSLFLDSESARDFSDFNSTIYGHHMEEGTMFGDLDLFREESFFQSHKYGSLFFDGQDHGLEIFAALEVSAYDERIYRTGDIPAAERETYLAYLKENALFYREAGITADDHIVILSTCASDSTSGRLVLAARISSETFENPFAEDQETDTGSGAEGKSRLSLLILAGVLFLLAVMAVLAVRWKKRNKKSGGENSNERKKKK